MRPKPLMPTLIAIEPLLRMTGKTGILAFPRPERTRDAPNPRFAAVVGGIAGREPGGAGLERARAPAGGRHRRPPPDPRRGSAGTRTTGRRTGPDPGRRRLLGRCDAQ